MKFGVLDRFRQVFLFLSTHLFLLLLVSCGEAKTDASSILLNDRGVAEMGRYEYVAAFETFSQVVRENPGWVDARVNLAIATLNRQEEGDELRALEILTTALKDDPEDSRALYTSGIIHSYLGEPAQAAVFFRRVTEIDPKDAYAAYFLGQSLLQEGLYEQAAEWLVKAVDLDPYLRSAYWAGSQALRRVGRTDDSVRLLDEYQRFAPNPAARVAGFSYRKMGPKAEAIATTPTSFLLEEKPSGPLFNEPLELASGNYKNASVTTVDINGDGTSDLLVSGQEVSIFSGSQGHFLENKEHPLVEYGFEKQALWGDVNDDGFMDVVFCGQSGSIYLQQSSKQQWTRQVEIGKECRSGALFDMDHDGDLDWFSTGSSGNELVINNRNGTFREAAAEMGLDGTHGSQVLVYDLDNDRDLDIIVVNRGAPNDVWQNDRTWIYTDFPGLSDFRSSSLVAVTVGDVDADGHVELYGALEQGGVVVWHFDGANWNREDYSVGTVKELGLTDFDGDGRPELLLTKDDGIEILDPLDGDLIYSGQYEAVVSAIPVLLDDTQRPALAIVQEPSVSILPPGSGRFGFVNILPTGKSEAEQMRSNISGIGTRLRIRVAGKWTVAAVMDAHSGGGQSHGPISVGLRGYDRVDFVALEWSDGVWQTEGELLPGNLHVISEVQRQLASCPVVFVWDGESYRFVTDVLGVGGLGFFSSPGQYAPPRPFERYLLNANELASRDGRYHVKLTEPMEENAYLDAATLVTIDVPQDSYLVLDERTGINGPEVTGRAIPYVESADPIRVTDQNGKNITELLLSADRTAPDPGVLDRRFIGLLENDQTITVEFGGRIDREGAVLVADGWVEYPYSQTVFAAWQAGINYRSATLEARDRHGIWHEIVREFGYPAGMPRQMALPLGVLPEGTDAIRLSRNMEIYWDRIQVVYEQSTDLRTQITRPSVARIARTGFSKRTTSGQRVPDYDYSKRSPYWDVKTHKGFYTSLGNALPLVEAADGALAIIGGGEEIHLEFDEVAEPPEGYRRYFVIEFRGWAKDMDLYTQHGDTVGPLPMPPDMNNKSLARRNLLHGKYNVRYQEGF